MRALLGIFGLLFAASLSAQDTVYVQSWSPLVGAVATTGCMGGRIYQALDMSYIGSEIFEEVVAHEAVHKGQYEKYLAAHAGACPSLPPMTLLSWEIEAYCAGRVSRHQRELRQVGDAAEQGDAEPTMEDTDNFYISLLKGQFQGQLSQALVRFMYRQQCSGE